MRLTMICHQHGVNMRLLGHIYRLVRSPDVLCTRLWDNRSVTESGRSRGLATLLPAPVPPP